MMNQKSLDPYQESVSQEFAFNDHKKGTQRSLFNKLKFNSISSSGGQVSIYSKSTDSLIDKRMYIQLKVTVADANKAPGVIAITAALDTVAKTVGRTAPRPLPVNGLIQNASVTINGANISTQSSDLVYAFQRCAAMPDDMRYYSTTPCQLDPVANLADVPRIKVYQAGTEAGQENRTGSVVGTYYAVENPQSPFLSDQTTISNGLGTFASDSLVPRGCFPYTDNGEASRTFVFTEPLLHGMLNDGDEISAFCNISKIDITLNFHSGQIAYNKIMSHVAAMGGVGTVVVDEAFVLYREMSPTVPLPSVFRDNFSQYMVQRQNVGTAAVAQDTALDTVNFSNIVFSTHPSKLYIFCKPRDGAHLPKVGNCFSVPSSLSITAGTNAGLLSGLGTEGLYLLSLDNGLKACNYQQYSKYLGGMIVLDCAKDLGLTPGRREQLNINFTLSSKTPFRVDTIEWECVCISVLPSTLEISKERCYVYEGFSIQDEQEAEANDEATDDSITMKSKSTKAGMKGNGFDYKKMLNVGKSALRIGATLGKAAQSTGMLPPGLNSAAAALGMANQAINKGSGFQPRGLSGAGRLGAGRLLQ